MAWTKPAFVRTRDIVSAETWNAYTLGSWDVTEEDIAESQYDHDAAFRDETMRIIRAFEEQMLRNLFDGKVAPASQPKHRRAMRLVGDI